LPAGDVKIGPFDYNLYTNSQLSNVERINEVPLKMVDGHPVLVADVGKAKDDAAIQTNIVRVNGQRSVYIPVLKSGADANTIAVVDGIRSAVSHLLDIPKQLQTNVVFDQSAFVKTAIDNLIHEGLIGLVLTGLMILIFLGNARATLAVFLSIPLSALATFLVLYFGGSSINAMILGGLALAFSRLIDNSVIVLENIFRHMELGETPEVAAENGGKEVALAVLAATLTTAIVFFPVTFLSGVSVFLFSALASAVVLSLFASYFVAMTVVPLFCAKLIKAHQVHAASGEAHHQPPRGLWNKFNWWFNNKFHSFLDRFDRVQGFALARPAATVIGILGIFCLSFTLLPALGLAYFPRTDPGQFVINLKAATGTRVEITEREVAKTEDLIKKIVSPSDLRLVVSNIGVTPDLSSIYTSNSSTHTAYVQVSLNEDHKVGSYEYIDRVRAAMQRELPQLSTYFQTGGLVDAILNQGLLAPIDVQVSSNDLTEAAKIAANIRQQVSRIPGVADTYIPEDVDAPSLQLGINRYYAQEMGLSEHEVVSNIITSLTSDGMISPSYWVDPKSGNLYMLTVQFPDNTVRSLEDLKMMPVRSSDQKNTTNLGNLTDVKLIESPTEVDHYKLRRVIDVYVSTKGEELSRVADAVNQVVNHVEKPGNVVIYVRGIVGAMNSSMQSFGLGLILSLVLVYLVLVAQFRSFVDPFLILLAVPPGITGVLLILTITGTTLNIMSLMGLVMMVGIVVSNSILIVEFTHRLIADGMSLREAVQFAVRVRLRPILMTSLATVIGLIPMALALEAGSESYAPLARAIIGGLLVSVTLTVFIVPSAVYLVYRKRHGGGSPPTDRPATSH
ncbi:MAG TPA: efflux RND transporter permease subunit, partial [Chthoniobacterales bacterium]